MTQDSAQSSVTPEGTLVGSTDGAVTLSAGHNVHLTDANVLSQTGTTTVGQNVTIDAAMGSSDSSQKQSQSSGGITGGLGGALADRLQVVQGSLYQSSQSTDPRLKALYAAQAAYAVKDSVGLAATTAGQVSKDGTDGGINLQLGIGGSHASASTRTHDEVAAGSQINSQGNVTIAATDGDLNVIGSQIKGTNVALAASHNLNLLSQAEQHTDTSRNQNASGGVGVQIGTDGLGIYAQAAVGEGKAHGNGTTHDDATVTASNQLSLISGNDTAIQGAQAKGNSVLADIGGNLHIASEQDTNVYASKQWAAAGKVVIGYSSGGSFSYSQGKIDSNYASVTQTSGIGAGSRGYAINVGGNTDLKGGVIASSADANRNWLSTGTLTTSDINNKSSYSASQEGISASYSSTGGFSAMPSMSLPQGKDASSTTQAGIAQGVIEVRNNPNQNLRALDRAPILGATGLTSSFNLQTVQTDQQLGDVAGYVGMRAAGVVEQMAGIDNGTAGATAIHAVVGGAVAALGGGNALQGAAGAAAGEAVIPYLTKYGTNGVLLGTALVGALVGGGDGAATSLDGTKYNYLTHPQLETLQKKVNQCGGDQVCIQQALTAAEIVSGTQEQRIVTGCIASGAECRDNYAGGIGDAINYVGDPLATKLGLQVDQSISNRDYVNNLSQWGLVKADNAVSHDGNLMLGVAAAGITTALGAGPGILAAESSGAISFGSLWQFALVTRGGTAATTGAINLSAQLFQNGGSFSQVNYINVGASTLGGYLGNGGNMAWNGLVGTGLGMVQTEANNLYYNHNNSLLMGGLVNGVFTVAGYGIGTGFTTSLQTPVFTSLSPVVWGNVIGSSATEGINWAVEKIKESQDVPKKVRQ